MISRACERAVTSISQALRSISGQIPRADSNRTARAVGMISPVRGIAMRFVSRKWTGKVPKYNQARGPVVIWHEMDMAAVVQTHLNGLEPCFIRPDSHLLLTASSSSSGQNPFSHGKMKAMPAMAAYDSWNPTSRMADGSIARCMTSAESSTVPVLLKRPCRRALSPSRMNRKALTIDAPAPVARV